MYTNVCPIHHIKPFLSIFQTRIICTVKNARIIICILFVFVFGARSHFLVYTKEVFSNVYVCWQIFYSVQDEKFVLVAESIVGYSCVFVVFVENIILIVLLATRKNIQVSYFSFERKWIGQNVYFTPYSQFFLSFGLLFTYVSWTQWYWNPFIIILALSNVIFAICYFWSISNQGSNYIAILSFLGF